MSELSFLAFCITVIALVAIVYGKDSVAVKALSTLGEAMKALLSVSGDLFKQMDVPFEEETQDSVN